MTMTQLSYSVPTLPHLTVSTLPISAIFVKIKITEWLLTTLPVTRLSQASPITHQRDCVFFQTHYFIIGTSYQRDDIRERDR